MDKHLIKIDTNVSWYAFPMVTDNHSPFIGRNNKLSCPICSNLFGKDIYELQRHMLNVHDNYEFERWGYNRKFMNYLNRTLSLESERTQMHEEETRM